jgi:hypothetical protein
VTRCRATDRVATRSARRRDFDGGAGILPFIVADLLRLALLVAFPMRVPWLPGAMF